MTVGIGIRMLWGITKNDLIAKLTPAGNLYPRTSTSSASNLLVANVTGYNLQDRLLCYQLFQFYHLGQTLDVGHMSMKYA